jgi:hypothetical protein
MQLPKLAGIKTVPGTDLIETAKAFVSARLASLSVKGAIKCLTSQKTSPTRQTTNTSQPATHSERSKQTKHVDIVAAWINAPPEERTRAINSIGFEPLITDRQQPAPTELVPVNLIQDDLSTPPFRSRRRPHSSGPGRRPRSRAAASLSSRSPAGRAVTHACSPTEPVFVQMTIQRARASSRLI